MEMKSCKKVIRCFLPFSAVISVSHDTILKTPDKISISERRNLETPPDLSAAAIMDGSFFTDCEKYMLDQFPFRDEFRRIKSYNLF